MAPLAVPHVEHLARTPAGPLGLAVARTTGYRMSGFAPGHHAGLPSPSLTVIFSFDDPLTLSRLPDPHEAGLRHWTVVGGLHTRPATIDHDGEQHGIQLDVTPLGSRLLFGRPAADLAEGVVPLDEVLGPLAAELHERLWATPGWDERLDLLEALLSRRMEQLDARTTVRRELRWAWAQLCAGASRVDDLADELGWSRRHLSAQFRREFGLSPRTIGRVARFDRARRLLRAGATSAGPRWSEVAQLSGYADQAHLTREWSRLAGASPAAWWADEEFPSVQDQLTSGAAG